MLETCRGPQFLINRIKSASHWFHYTDEAQHCQHGSQPSDNSKPVPATRNSQNLSLSTNH
jgi:hypothetical protein